MPLPYRTLKDACQSQSQGRKTEKLPTSHETIQTLRRVAEESYDSLQNRMIERTAIHKEFYWKLEDIRIYVSAEKRDCAEKAFGRTDYTDLHAFISLL